MTQAVNISLSRRSFLKASGVATGGLVVATSLQGCGSSAKPVPYAKDFQPNAFLQVSAKGDVLFLIPNAEMGQGIKMGLSTLVAEELNMAPAAVETKFAGSHKAYNMPSMGAQITGGSTTIKERFLPLRQAAASVADVMLSAAARDLGVAKSELTLRNKQIVHAGKQYDWAQFIATAKTLPVAESIALKSPKDFTLIGKDRTPRTDAIAKVTGSAEFGMDVKVPNAKVAVVVASPVYGGSVKSFDATNAKSMSGVQHVVTIFNGVAIVADTYWQARQAAKSVSVEWNNPELAKYSNSNLETELQQALDSEEGLNAFEQGDTEKAFAKAKKTHSAQYKAPYLAHATMEPMNCTVQIKNGAMDVWIPTQAPGLAAQVASEHSGISRENIRIHSTFLGGGFGRRAGHDYLAQAAEIALQTGETIQLVWSREDDTQQGYYRPISWVKFDAGLDDAGKLSAWQVKRAGPNVFPYLADEVFGALVPEFLPKGMVDWISKRPYGVFADWTTDHSSVEGLYEDYDIENKTALHETVDPGLRCGFWRSVGHSFSGFFKECFMDEMAHEAGADPVAFRLSHLDGNPRLKRTVELAAEKAGWATPKAGRALGIATHKSFESYVAQVAEVSVSGGQIKVHKVVCVIDCGIAVNPDIVKSQMESGINFGLSAALHQKVTLKDGAIEQSNFHDFQILRMNEAPDIEVHIVQSEEAPTGVGEPGTPPIAAAVANAVFAASGKRLRELPLSMA
ncbi:MAG: molybdopterin-dependent oxidoreductase [Alteromonadaceae bacterium]|nr:molybdopterin-dependent oxidoreductase [Alteromonadaceae bacterium]